MDRKKLKTRINTMLSFTMFLSILFCFVFMTYSWLSINRNVDNTGMRIGLDAPNGVEVESFQIYKRNGATDSADLIIDTSSSSYNKDDVIRFEMTEYDTVFADRNVNTPIIIRVELKNIKTFDNGKPYPISVDFSCLTEDYTEEKNITYKDKTTGQIVQTTKNVMKNILSNILYIQCAIIKTSTADDEVVNMDTLDISDDAGKIYEGAINYFKTKDKTTFLTVDSSTKSYEKDKKISFDINDYVLDANGNAIVYFELNYAEDNVGQYIDEHLINVEDTTDGVVDSISFNFDLSELTFIYSENNHE